jgi:hypothetical protein
LSWIGFLTWYQSLNDQADTSSNLIISIYLIKFKHKIIWVELVLWHRWFNLYFFIKNFELNFILIKKSKFSSSSPIPNLKVYTYLRVCSEVWWRLLFKVFFMPKYIKMMFFFKKIIFKSSVSKRYKTYKKINFLKTWVSLRFQTSSKSNLMKMLLRSFMSRKDFSHGSNQVNVI